MINPIIFDILWLRTSNVEIRTKNTFLLEQWIMLTKQYEAGKIGLMVNVNYHFHKCLKDKIIPVKIFNN